MSAFLLGPVCAFGQSTESDDINLIQNELNRSTPAKSKQEAGEGYKEMQPAENKLKDFSGLGSLAPFNEISVIQKRFSPKTGRFQLFGGGTILTNNPFFNTVGISAKAGYFLTETWGLELNYMGLSTSERQTTKELRDIQGVKSENLVYPKSFSGLDLVYVPIYGKIAWFNEKIIPFDLYFTGGYGITNTQIGKNESTTHLGTGQIFSFSKSYAFRWDFSWNVYNATGVDGSTNSFNNLFLTIGMSWFFPEASYR
jgi:outer membrane beta-barrel protein